MNQKKTTNLHAYREPYVSPAVESVSVHVENGFAVSTDAGKPATNPKVEDVGPLG